MPDRNTPPATPVRPRKARLVLAVYLGCAAAAGTAGLLSAAPAQAQAAEQQIQSYSIPAGPLNQTLSRFIEQSGLFLAGTTAMTEGKQSPGVQGELTAEQALRRLLAGTGVTYRFTDADTVTLVSTGSDDSLSVDPITVTATRGNSVQGQTPQKTTIITREQIEQQLKVTEDRGQVLANLIPGYTPSRQKLTNSGETFRGREALILIDGVPQSNPLRDSARDGYTIDLSMVERIEVIHGASAEHGLGATGGIINYVTKRASADDTPHKVSTQVTADDGFHEDGLGYKLGYQFSGQSGDWDYIAGATFQERGIFYDGDGRRVGIDEISGEVQDSTSYDLFGKVGYWLGEDQNVEFSLNRFELVSNHDYVAVDGDRDTETPTSSREGNPPNDAPFNKATTANLAYNHLDWLGNQLRTQLYYQRFRAQFGTHPTAFPYTDDQGNSRLDQTRTESDKIGAKLTLSRDGLFDDRLKLTTGMDLIQDETRQVLVQTDRTYVPLSRLQNVAGFLQGELAALDNLSLHAGVRYEYVRIEVDDYSTIDRSNVRQDQVQVDGGSPSFQEPLFNAGLVYQVTPWLQLFGNYSEGFGLPDVGRALRGISQPDQDVDELVELEPIVTDNREIGIRVEGANYGAELSYYESNSDLGERLTQEGTTFVGSRERMEIQGVDLTGHYRPTDAHTLKLIYAYNQGKSDTDGDGDVDTELSGFNVAPQRLTLSWQAGWNGRLSSYLSATHYFDRNFSDQSNDNLDEFDGYDLLDASVSYDLPLGNASLGIHNLLDEQYIQYYSQTARDGDRQYFAGRGRTYTLSYEVDF